MSRPTGVIMAPPKPWTMRLRNEGRQRLGQAAQHRASVKNANRGAEDVARAERNDPRSSR